MDEVDFFMTLRDPKFLVTTAQRVIIKVNKETGFKERYHKVCVVVMVSMIMVAVPISSLNFYYHLSSSLLECSCITEQKGPLHLDTYVTHYAKKEYTRKIIYFNKYDLATTPS